MVGTGPYSMAWWILSQKAPETGSSLILILRRIVPLWLKLLSQPLCFPFWQTFLEGNIVQAWLDLSLSRGKEYMTGSICKFWALSRGSIPQEIGTMNWNEVVVGFRLACDSYLMLLEITNHDRHIIRLQADLALWLKSELVFRRIVIKEISGTLKMRFMSMAFLTSAQAESTCMQRASFSACKSQLSDLFHVAELQSKRLAMISLPRSLGQYLLLSGVLSLLWTPAGLPCRHLRYHLRICASQHLGDVCSSEGVRFAFGDI